MISSMPKWVGDLVKGLMVPKVRVVKISLISPQLKKIRFQGQIDRMNFQIGYANVIRVSETEYRNYTVAYYDVKEGIMDFVFHIHGNGIGSRVIDALKIGDELFITGPRGRKEYDPAIKRYLIFGDETSLGLACAFLPVLRRNHHLFQFSFELDEANSNAPAMLGLENYTVFPKDGSFRNGEWVSRLPVFNQLGWNEARFVLTGNVRSVQTFRKVVKNKAKGKASHQGYWLEGKKGL
ncbi:siderophore-interacting protein [Algoriphagus resistens]|uniref:siderophore-interacting protein n=1 Tax=Algoriphagus resistens TaxID=1750590 RepID=UPI0009E68E44|nr:FAD-binding oxidoreductase [Algoriphagus resistens]